MICRDTNVLTKTVENIYLSLNLKNLVNNAMDVYTVFEDFMKDQFKEGL